MKNDFLRSLPKERLIELIEDYAKNWLAMDGVWFQSVERKWGMDEAMYHDAEAWRRFTVIEAKRIKAFLGLEELTYRTRECRVQRARERKGMPFHPCKPVGEIEYAGFARTIDERIACQCVSCFPDVTDPSCCCAWRFWIEEPSSR